MKPEEIRQIRACVENNKDNQDHHTLEMEEHVDKLLAYIEEQNLEIQQLNHNNRELKKQLANVKTAIES